MIILGFQNSRFLGTYLLRKYQAVTIIVTYYYTSLHFYHVHHFLAKTHYFPFFGPNLGPNICKVLPHCVWLNIALLTKNIGHLFMGFFCASSISLPTSNLGGLSFHDLVVHILCIILLVDSYQISDQQILSITFQAGFHLIVFFDGQLLLTLSKSSLLVFLFGEQMVFL